jgi:arylsulfatase A-like enzyme
MRRALMFLAALLASLYSSCPLDAGEKKMNLICICTDDQGYWSIGAYGNKESKTPHMDRIAREGALFKHAFCATPVCSPSRASFLTGRYGSQVKITDWINPTESKAGVGLAANAMTWMRVLQRAGYCTGLIGKWHLGELAFNHPTKCGFDHFMGLLGGGNQPMDRTLEIDGQVKNVKGSLPDILTDNAIEFVTKNKSHAFALMLNTREPHLPYGPVPAEDAAVFKNLDPTIPNFLGLDVKQVKRWTSDYYASIHSVDRNIGRLLAVLEQLGLLENTIILFTSDHGYMIGHHGLHTKGNATWVVGPNRGVQRGNMYDLSLRVPLFIRWPGVVRPGTTIDEFVCNIDMFSTALGMLKVQAPPDYKQEGKDFSPILRGEKIVWRDAHFSQFDIHNGLGKKAAPSAMRSVRTLAWHLVRQYNKNHPDELFDLINDPDELINLYDVPAHRAIREQLQKRLDEWMRGIDDPILKRTNQ